MIHQFIFAGPKPGLPAEAFQSYWVNFHAVDYASKIKQIRRYLVATRLPSPASGSLPFFEGVAEIWLANDEEQIASLQSPEFLQGARADEPRWAAFWRTMGLDTDPEAFTDKTVLGQLLPEFVKVYFLLKRRPGTDLEDFKELLRQGHAARAAGLPALQRSLIGFARQGLYALGEPLFDAVEAWSFEDGPQGREALGRLLEQRLGPSAGQWLDLGHAYSWAGREHWIIRPGQREPA